jgi:hypothetical protein
MRAEEAGQPARRRRCASVSVNGLPHGVPIGRDPEPALEGDGPLLDEHAFTVGSAMAGGTSSRDPRSFSARVNQVEHRAIGWNALYFDRERTIM